MQYFKLLLFLWCSLWTAAIPVPATVADSAAVVVQPPEGTSESAIQREAAAQQIPLNLCQLDIPLPYDLREYTCKLADDAGISPAVLFAIMEHESGYQMDAVGYNANGTVDAGLMQINSCNWAWLAAEEIDVHTPEGNIQAAVRILGIYTENYPLEQALACYAAGEGGMKNGGGKRFASAIITRAEEMEQQLEEEN